MYTTVRRGAYVIDTDPAHLDLVAAHAFLTCSYWSPGASLEQVQRAAAHSLCFGLFHDGAQVGYARVISDQTTFAYLADVYVLEEHRGQGLSKWLVETVLAHPDLQGLRRFLLFTADAHGLYAQYGFEPVDDPGRMMQRRPLQSHV